MIGEVVEGRRRHNLVVAARVVASGSHLEHRGSCWSVDHGHRILINNQVVSVLLTTFVHAGARTISAGMGAMPSRMGMISISCNSPP